MNPIPLNDRGQFRYADFVEYIPEFLWEEPDVVELLQVMSDYINDAYRNIEDVEEFEFKFCVAEAKVELGKRQLERLRTMFQLASGRGDRVYYLSVPRANVKSNAVFGKANGYTPYYIDIGLSEVTDEITGISGIDRKIGELSDGDVVFVRYMNLDPVVVKSYYYSVASGSLILDKDGTTQDPFTDTDNSAGRMISFLVDDISSVGKRFGGLCNGNGYYEVFFNARVSEVKSESATGAVQFDADNVNSTKDTLVVDYYGTGYEQSGKYYTTMGFCGEDGWAWKSGFPTGMFYLKDTSGAHLAGIGESVRNNEVMAEDPSLEMASDKYTLSKDAVFDEVTGLWSFSTNAAMPQVNGAKYYIVDKTSGDMLAEFVMAGDTEIEGSYVSKMMAVGYNPYADAGTIPADGVFIMTFPLFYSKGVPDYSTAKPSLMWTSVGGDASIEWKDAVLRRCQSRSDVKTIGATFNVGGDNADYTAYAFRVPASVYFAMEEENVPELYCDNILWDGLQKPAKIYQKSNGTYWVQMLVPLKIPAEPTPITLRSGFVSMLEIDEKGTSIWTDPYSIEGLRGCLCADGTDAEVSCFIAAYGNTGKVHAARIKAVLEDGELLLSDKLGEGTYACTIMDVRGEDGTVKSVSSVTRVSDEYYRGAAEKYTGDVFSDGMFYAHDRTGNMQFVQVGDPEMQVTIPVTGKQYAVNDMVSSGGILYRCISPCVMTDGGPEAMEEFTVETTAGYRIEYTEVYNKFIPYCGQVKAMDFGERIDYTGDMHVTTLPLYITKVVENRLKYGWEHREFLNYGTDMDMSGRDRNGSLDIFSSARSGDNPGFETTMDAVTATLDSKAKWKIDYPVLKNGAESVQTVDIDNPVAIPVEYGGDYWTVSMQSAGHGLVEGVQLKVSGYDTVGGIDINGYRTVHLVDGDNFTFRIPAEQGYSGAHSVYIPVSSGATVSYIADYRVGVKTIIALPDEGNYRLALDGELRGVSAGTKLELVDLEVDCGKMDGEAVFDAIVVSVIEDTDGTWSVIVETDTETLPGQLGHEFQLRRGISANDYVIVGDDIYRVGNGQWEQKEMHDMSVPSVLVSRQNIMDVSATNPELAIGEDIEIDVIMPNNLDSATVRLKGMISHFTPDNASIIENRTMVYIRGVTPSQYNGWHTVTRVISPKAFDITVRLSPKNCEAGSGMNGEPMYLNEGRWYAYTVKGVDWDKVSNRVTYSLNNTITSTTKDGEKLATEYPHGLSEGEYVVVGKLDEIVKVDCNNFADADIKCYRVTGVYGDTGLRLADLDGNPVTDIGGKSIARGVLLTDREDDLGSLRNEYTRELASLGGAKYRFKAGDIVVALAQQNPDEIKAWRVAAKAQWQPVRSKRSMKISALGVYSYGNGKFNGVDVEADEDTEKYETVSDVDIAGYEDDIYVAGYHCVAHQNFSVPALDDVDTTRSMNEQYSSRYDYSTVSPRYNMKSSFRGIPSMKYPLLEKIERLCYLRDAHVIDYDVIEYLARFLGYDITALGDDVEESNLYRTRSDRELAVRETIANLPQYYALGGTKPGLHMLMSAFGVISDVITLWTDANYPYNELIGRDAVQQRMEDGDDGKWVPTPYIDIEVTLNASLPQFSATQSDIERLREQIRVFKPINVVFRDFVYKLVDTVRIKPTISIDGITGSSDCGAVTSSGNELVIEYSDESLNNCAF